jgi:hypothetical protein
MAHHAVPYSALRFWLDTDPNCSWSESRKHGEKGPKDPSARSLNNRPEVWDEGGCKPVNVAYPLKILRGY